MTKMKETTLLLAPSLTAKTHTKSVNAIVEVDEFGSPFAIEVLWLKKRAGEGDAERLLQLLKDKQITHSYSEDIDALTLSFGEGSRSCGQESGVLTLDFNGDKIIGLLLREST